MERLKCTVLFSAALLLAGCTIRVTDIPVSEQPIRVVYEQVNKTETQIPTEEIIKYLVEETSEEHTPTVEEREPPQYLFIGNSLVTGLKGASQEKNSFVCKVGISLNELNRKHVPSALKKAHNTVVIEMGTNELGVYSKDEFVTGYTELVEAFNGEDIYCLSIPPINERKSSYRKSVNNSNVQLYNSYIEEVCNATGATYLNCEGFFGNTLNSDWTGDGIHLKSDIYAEWLLWITTIIEGSAA